VILLQYLQVETLNGVGIEARMSSGTPIEERAAIAETLRKGRPWPGHEWHASYGVAEVSLSPNHGAGRKTLSPLCWQSP